MRRTTLLIALAVVGLSATPASAEAPAPTGVYSAGGYLEKPSRMALNSPGLHMRATHLQWKRWGKAVTTARGRVSGCASGGSGSCFHDVAVQVRLSRPRTDATGSCLGEVGARAYTRVKFKLHGRWSELMLDDCEPG
jgi:hypothetical protein